MVGGNGIAFMMRILVLNVFVVGVGRASWWRITGSTTLWPGIWPRICRRSKSRIVFE
jgi:hypothetical protein